MGYTPRMAQNRCSSFLLRSIVFAFAAVCGTALFAQDSDHKADKAILRYDDVGAYRLTERSDWARYDNGKYVGHVYREVRGSLTGGAGNEYHGKFYVLEETLRDLRASSQAIDDVRDAAFRIGGDGSFVALEDNGFPSLRGFPAFPAAAVAVGQKWTARFIRAVDPRNTGTSTLLPLIAEFEYRGEDVYKDQPVRRIFAKYATRYRGGSAAKSAPPFAEAAGTHDVDILIHAITGRTVLIRDRLDETFIYPDKSSVRFKGFTLTFAEGGLGGERGALIAKLKGKDTDAKVSDQPRKPSSADGQPSPKDVPSETPKAIADPPPLNKPANDEPKAQKQPETARSDIEPARVPEAPFELADSDDGGGRKPVGITVEETDAGVKLTVKDLRFAPDSDQLLPEERRRLELLARSLKSAAGRSFLVEGHTAAVGKTAGELDLSKRRAKRIVDELTARGIPADRFIYKGWGGTKPLASNADEAGRSRNRRVEITIMD